MYVVSVFEHSLKLELALSELEEHDIPKERIMAVPLNKRPAEKTYFDPYNSDGTNLFLVSCLATVCMLLGIIYGFILHWGPVLWGLIGLLAGVAAGVIIDIAVKRSGGRKGLQHQKQDVVLLIRCEKHDSGVIENILIQHQAIGISTIP